MAFGESSLWSLPENPKPADLPTAANLQVALADPEEQP